MSRSSDRGEPWAIRRAGDGSHAVVIGGSMAGLLAARVLASHFERVTLVERDALPEGMDARKGVPQGRMPHVMLPRGQRTWSGYSPVTAASSRQLGRWR
jgi:flavin-dependent dehydrogenase